MHDQSSGLVTLSEEMITTRSARSLVTIFCDAESRIAEAQATLMVGWPWNTVC